MLPQVLRVQPLPAQPLAGTLLTEGRLKMRHRCQRDRPLPQVPRVSPVSGGGLRVVARRSFKVHSRGRDFTSLWKFVCCLP